MAYSINSDEQPCSGKCCVAGSFNKISGNNTPQSKTIAICLSPRRRKIFKMDMIFHPWCDSVSTFSCKVKVKYAKLLFKEKTFQQALGELGMEYEPSDDIFKKVEKFVCQLYC